MTERSARISGDNVELEGVLHLPDGVPPFAGVAVCHPHPQYGGDMNNTVVAAVCRALTDRGMAALRFNFRGVGRSTGAYDGGQGEARDATAAVAFLAEQDEIESGTVGLAGYSFGAMAALAGASERVQALALVSPPLQGVSKERLSGYDGPLLMITGDSDHICPAAAFREMAASLTREVEAEVVPGADHFWMGYERDLGALVGPFFARTLIAGEAV
ncbi:MAG: alpha/beta hydrolase [Dehalococcoidia bacterium]